MLKLACASCWLMFVIGAVVAVEVQVRILDEGGRRVYNYAEESIKMRASVRHPN